MEKTFNRRTCMMLASTIPFAVTASPGIAASENEGAVINYDPHQAWFEEWKRLRAEWTTDGMDADGEENEHGAALWKAADELERKMSNTMATTREGAAAQIEWMLTDSTDADFQVGHWEALSNALATLRG